MDKKTSKVETLIFAQALTVVGKGNENSGRFSGKNRVSLGRGSGHSRNRIVRKHEER